MKEKTKKSYQSPSLTVYGSAATITANQGSQGSDAPFTGDTPNSYYSVGE